MRSTSRPSSPCIVLPTDFQQPARRAFNYALKLASVYGVRLEIVHVIKTVSESSQVSPESRSLNSLKTSALLELGRLTSMAKDAGINAQPRLLFGGPSDCILESAAACHAGLIVMGTHGHTGWDRLRLGSTAQAVVREASCPVLTLQEVVARDSFRHHAKVSLDRLLVATDFSPCADAALRYVSGMAARLKAQVCIVHAADEGMAHKLGQRKLRILTRELQQNGIAAESMSAPGDPVEIILRLAAQWQADVIAAGTQGRRGLSRMLLGSVAETLLGRAGCPVLILRNGSQLLPAGDRHERRRTSS
ncbi:MAG: universal stress protein [Nitrospira sp.]